MANLPGQLEARQAFRPDTTVAQIGPTGLEDRRSQYLRDASGEVAAATGMLEKLVDKDAQTEASDAINKYREKLVESKSAWDKELLQNGSSHEFYKTWTDVAETHRTQLRDTLKNPFASKYFDAESQPVTIANKAQLLGHQSQQSELWSQSVRNTTVKQLTDALPGQLAGQRPEDQSIIIGNAVLQANAATTKYLRGRFNDNSTEGIAFLNSALSEDKDGIWASAINNDLVNNNPAGAKQLLDMAKKEMSASGYQKIAAHANPVIIDQNTRVIGGQSTQAVVAKAQAAAAALPTSINGAPTDGNYHPAVAPLEKYLITQESGGKQFYPPGKKNSEGQDIGGQTIVSPAGAIGKWQVMPGTEAEVAGILGIKSDLNKLKTDEKYNEMIGKTYLDIQLKRFDGNIAMALAAYNAGPQAVERWVTPSRRGGAATEPAAFRNQVVQQMKNPSKGEITNEEWAKQIPYKETRDYVLSIMGGMSKDGVVVSEATSEASRETSRLQSVVGVMPPQMSKVDYKLLRGEVEADARARAEKFAPGNRNISDQTVAHAVADLQKLATDQQNIQASNAEKTQRALFGLNDSGRGGNPTNIVELANIVGWDVLSNLPAGSVHGVMVGLEANQKKRDDGGKGKFTNDPVVFTDLLKKTWSGEITEAWGYNDYLGKGLSIGGMGELISVQTVAREGSKAVNDRVLRQAKILDDIWKKDNITLTTSMYDGAIKEAQARWFQDVKTEINGVPPGVPAERAAKQLAIVEKYSTPEKFNEYRPDLVEAKKKDDSGIAEAIKSKVATTGNREIADAIPIRSKDPVVIQRMVDQAKVGQYLVVWDSVDPKTNKPMPELKRRWKVIQVTPGEAAPEVRASTQQRRNEANRRAADTISPTGVANGQ